MRISATQGYMDEFGLAGNSSSEAILRREREAFQKMSDPREPAKVVATLVRIPHERVRGPDCRVTYHVQAL